MPLDHRDGYVTGLKLQRKDRYVDNIEKDDLPLMDGSQVGVSWGVMWQPTGLVAARHRNGRLLGLGLGLGGALHKAISGLHEMRYVHVHADPK